jgi:ABC-type cobalamin transport system ATPase subunit
VSLDVAEGEFVSVMGPSVSGKSTLLNLVGGLERPTAGAVVLRGRRVDALSERRRAILRRREIGFVFQFFNPSDGPDIVTTPPWWWIALMIPGAVLLSALASVLSARRAAAVRPGEVLRYE